MSLDTAALRAAARKGAERDAEATRRPAGPITRRDFAPAVVCAVDATVSSSGMVVVDSRGIDISIMRSKTFKTTAPGLDGYEVYFAKAEQLADMLDEEFGKLAGSFPGIQVVHEAPPIGGGKFINPESSLMACREVRRAARRHGLRVCPMVAPKTHKVLVLGAGGSKAEKSDVRKVLPGFAASIGVTGYNLVTNADERDSLCVALAHLHRQGAAA